METRNLDQFDTAEQQKSAKHKIASILKDFPDALEAVVRVMEFGASKPGRQIGGWRQDSVDIPHYFEDALLRHQFEIWKGNMYDGESMELHLAHKACNDLMELQLILEGKLNVNNK